MPWMSNPKPFQGNYISSSSSSEDSGSEPDKHIVQPIEPAWHLRAPEGGWPEYPVSNSESSDEEEKSIPIQTEKLRTKVQRLPILSSSHFRNTNRATTTIPPHTFRTIQSTSKPIIIISFLPTRWSGNWAASLCSMSLLPPPLQSRANRRRRRFC